MGYVSEWYLENLKYLRNIYGQIKYDNEEYEWFRLEHFKLPPIYLSTHTKLLITTPGLSGIENKYAWNFFISQGLKRRDGKDIDHLYDSDGYNFLAHKNYARLCVNPLNFKPSLNFIQGDNICDLAEMVYGFLAKK